MPRAAWFVLVLLAIGVCSAQTKKQAELASLDPMSQLERAEVMSQGFAPEERIDALFDLARTARRLGSPKVKGWSLEMFELTKSLPPSQFRTAMQKNALNLLAPFDASLAADLYKQQSSPLEWTSRKVIMEDSRAFGTRMLFPELWKQKGMGALPTIEGLSAWLGETGGYPYKAVGEIIAEVAKKDRERAQQLFIASIQYLDMDQRVRNVNGEFVDFVIRTWKDMPPSLAREAIERAIPVFDAAEENKDRPKLTAEVSTPDGKGSFQTERDLLIYRLLPVIRSIDPKWANSLNEKYPALHLAPNIASETQMNVSAVLTFPEQLASDQQVRSAYDEHRLMQVQQLVDNNPGQAVQIALNISDPANRAIALSTLAPARMKSNRNDAVRWLTEAKEELDSIPAGPQKLRLEVSLAKAYLATSRTREADLLFSRAFDLGEELISTYLQANPGAMLYSADGFEELSDLVRSRVSRADAPGTVAQRIEEIRNDVLQSRMIICLAQGLIDRREKAPSMIW